MKKIKYFYYVFQIIAMFLIIFNLYSNNLTVSDLERQINIYNEITLSKFDILFIKLSNLINSEVLIDIEAIKQANVKILNTTAIRNGSGTHIIINDKHYILTASHLVNMETDFIWAEINKELHPLGLIKIDYEKDLALFEIFMVDSLPALEIADKSPVETDEIMVIGNPNMQEDFITMGSIIKITADRYIFSNLIFYGNSGGAILYKGKLIGVASQVMNFYNLSVFVNYGVGIKLERIKEFLKGIN